MIKGSEEPGVDPLLALADDMTTKEPMGIVYSDVESVSIQPYNVTSYYMNLFLTEKEDFDKSKFDRVLNLHEKNIHPHDFELNYDIFISHEDQPVTLMQNQSPDGANFMVWSSRLALESKGRHYFNAHRRRQDETITTLSSVLVSTGMPLYGQGNVITLISNGFLPGDIRFGFEFQGGLSAKPGLSNANMNHFTVNGQVHKLGSMDPLNFDPAHKGVIKSLNLAMRDASS